MNLTRREQTHAVYSADWNLLVDLDYSSGLGLYRGLGCRYRVDDLRASISGAPPLLAFARLGPWLGDSCLLVPGAARFVAPPSRRSQLCLLPMPRLRGHVVGPTLGICVGVFGSRQVSAADFEGAKESVAEASRRERTAWVRKERVGVSASLNALERRQLHHLMKLDQPGNPWCELWHPYGSGQGLRFSKNLKTSNARPLETFRSRCCENIATNPCGCYSVVNQ